MTTTELATTPLVEPRVYLPYSYYDKDRTKTAEWVVAETDTADKHVKKIADLTIHHYKDRKQFVVRLGRSHNETRHGETVGFSVKKFTMFQAAPLDDVVILTKPVARYSTKARDEAFNEALEIVRNLADADEIARFFQNEGFAGE